MKLSLKTTLLASVFAASMVGTFVAVETMIPEESPLPTIVSTVYLEGTVSEESISPLVEYIDSTKSKTLLVIDSPGGSVHYEAMMMASLNTHKSADTYVPAFAASAAAQIFINGDHRYTEPGATFIFHGAAIGALSLNINDLEGMLVLKQRMYNSIIDKTSVQALEAAHDIYEFSTDINLIRAANEASLDAFDKIISESKGKLTRAIISRELFGDFKTQLVVTGKKLAEMGIAQLGKPSEDNYIVR